MALEAAKANIAVEVGAQCMCCTLVLREEKEFVELLEALDN